MLSATVARNYMVEGELFSLFAAVLAGKLVPVVNLGAADFSRNMKRSFDQVRQADDRRNRHVPIGRVNISIAIFQHFRPALVKQRQGTPDMTDVQRFIILVQNKDGMVKHCGTSLSGRISFILLEKEVSVQISSVLREKQRKSPSFLRRE